ASPPARSPGRAQPRDHRAVTTVNANVASKQLDPRAEPTAVGRRQHGMPKSDRCGVSPRRGVSDSTVTRTRRVAGAASLSGQLISVWRRSATQLATAVDANVAVPNVVGENKNHIGLLVLR